MTRRDTPIDFLIVTPLEEERDAVLALLDAPKQLAPDEQDNRVYYESKMAVGSEKEQSGEYRIVVVPLVAMGTGQASATTSDAIHRWSPRYVLVIGIAGGVRRSGVGLGDVLVADQVADYTLQKHRSGQDAEIRWQAQPVDTGLLERARAFSNKDWEKLIRSDRPHDGTPNRHIGPIASGDHVVASEELLDTYQEPWPKLIGVEMEAAGIARVAFQSRRQARFFMVRGVSDLADPAKDSPEVESWRTYACEAAAAYAIGFLRSGPVTLSSMDEAAKGQGEGSEPSFSNNKVSGVSGSTVVIGNQNKLEK